MENYGSDKPDLRFGMRFTDLTAIVKGHDFLFLIVQNILEESVQKDVQNIPENSLMN